MKLKKIASVLLSCVVAGTIFTGCGENPTPHNDVPTSVKIGMIKNLNASESLYNDTLKKISERTNVNLTSHEYTFYDSLTLLQMGLESGSVNEASTYQCVAKYLMARNPEFKIAPDHTHLKLADSFAFAMRADDTSLKDSVNAAITLMREDGTLDNLIKTYITDLNYQEDPPAVAFEHYDGADTIRVAVTGDLPPLDFVSADGKPAGFNTALLSELGKRLHKNIEVIDIDSAARAASLQSGKVDIAFWAIVPTGEDFPLDIDKPQGVELSAPYFRDDIIHISYQK